MSSSKRILKVFALSFRSFRLSNTGYNSYIFDLCFSHNCCKVKKKKNINGSGFGHVLWNVQFRVGEEAFATYHVFYRFKEGL